jgi:hypothetical protein
MSPHRPILLAAALASWVLVCAGKPCRAEVQTSESRPEVKSEKTSRSGSQQTVAFPGKSAHGVPPVPGQLVNGPGIRGAVERPKRVPPILIAFVLLFLITWVRSYWERRRLRAQFRQSCESPPQSYI